MIEIAVFPCSRKPGEFIFEVLGCLVARSRTPFLDAARRVLEAFPESSDDWIAMRHVNTDYVALRAKVGVAAGLTVNEGNHERPRFARWQANERFT
jgi:hypothetical protein